MNELKAAGKRTIIDYPYAKRENRLIGQQTFSMMTAKSTKALDIARLPEATRLAITDPTVSVAKIRAADVRVNDVVAKAVEERVK